MLVACHCDCVARKPKNKFSLNSSISVLFLNSNNSVMVFPPSFTQTLDTSSCMFPSQWPLVSFCFLWCIVRQFHHTFIWYDSPTNWHSHIILEYIVCDFTVSLCGLHSLPPTAVSGVTVLSIQTPYIHAKYISQLLNFSNCCDILGFPHYWSLCLLSSIYFSRRADPNFSVISRAPQLYNKLTDGESDRQ